MTGENQNQSTASTLAELRKMGWHVAAHHEFERHKQVRTFWLFSHDPCGRWIKAEGAARSEILVLQLALGDALDHHCDIPTEPREC